MIKIYAKKRYFLGTSESRKLRLKNFFPAVIYGKKKSSLFMILNQNDIINLFNKNTLENKNLLIILKNKNIHVKIKEVQMHPFKYKFSHIDFLRI